MRSMLLLAFAPALLPAQARPDTTRAPHDSARSLEAVTVRAIRARNEAPISSTTLDAAAIARRSFGQDVPIALQGVPSLTSYSETGNYWGYSYVRLRGIDQSRINLTLDGIPLNDPEDQVLYFADFPDLLNSVSSVQVQRGVGTSAPGTASYGGSINFETVPIATAPRGLEMQLQGGSFTSARASAEYASGVTPRGFAVYGRASALQSQGYRRHSGMQGRSAFLSAGHVGDRHVLKLTALAGLFADTLSYVGATPAELSQDRRTNPLRPDETDRFGEQIVALSYTRFDGARSSHSATLYRISASGNYEVCIAQCDQPAGDLWNFNLDFAWYGLTTAWTYDGDRLRLSTGANANTYARDHYAFDRPDFTQSLYFNTGHKDDASAFAKAAYDIGGLTLFADLQGRVAKFRYTPDRNAGIPGRAISWTFFNPKAGATLQLTPRLSAYASYGVNSREPGRSDMFAGFDNLDTSNVAFVGPLSRVRPERVHDTESGVRVRASRWSLDANVFAMEFRNEILPVGQLSYIGTPLRTNVRRSWRRGVETDFNAQLTRTLALGISGTAMRARIARFTDDESGATYVDVEPLLTPRFTAAHQFTYSPSSNVDVVLAGRYSSRAHLDNTGNPGLVVPESYVLDASAGWTRGNVGLTVFVNNATNTRRFGAGHVSFGEARYYVLPPRNFMAVVRITS